jgi:hypothetical protein
MSLALSRMQVYKGMLKRKWQAKSIRLAGLQRFDKIPPVLSESEDLDFRVELERIQQALLIKIR